jgi:hypothetical protein
LQRRSAPNYKRFASNPLLANKAGLVLYPQEAADVIAYIPQPA